MLPGALPRAVLSERFARTKAQGSGRPLPTSIKILFICVHLCPSGVEIPFKDSVGARVDVADEGGRVRVEGSKPFFARTPHSACDWGEQRESGSLQRAFNALAKMRLKHYDIVCERQLYITNAYQMH